jgi:hypothetical protein
MPRRLLDGTSVARNNLQPIGIGGAVKRLFGAAGQPGRGALRYVDFTMDARTIPTSVVDIVPDCPIEMMVPRKGVLHADSAAATVITHATIAACRHITGDKGNTIQNRAFETQGRVAG